ncbi:MAG: helix-turn-helix domain-containing protein [Candidatus Aenigmatarchaeota archaeon]
MKDIIMPLIEYMNLNRTEARVYITLLTLKEGKASEISKLSGVPRSKLYETTKNLHKRGFIEIVPEKIMRFRAIPIEKLFQLSMEQQQKRLSNMEETKNKMMEYLSSHSTPEKKETTGEFTIYRAKKVIQQKLEEMISTAEKSILLAVDWQVLKQLSYLVGGISKKSNVKILTSIEKENISVIKKWMKVGEVRNFKTLPLKFMINDREIMMFQTDTPTALHSSDEKFISLMKNFYDSAWEESPTAYEIFKAIETGHIPEETHIMRGREKFYEIFYSHAPRLKNDVMTVTTVNGVVRFWKYAYDVFKELHKKGVRLRIIGVITPENMEVAKIMSDIVEIRHIDKTPIALSRFDDLYVTLGYVTEDTQELKSSGFFIYSNHDGMITMVHDICEMLWEQAIPLEHKIRELEFGKFVTETHIIKNLEEGFEKAVEIAKMSEKELDISTSQTSLVKWDLNLIKDLFKKGIKIRIAVPISQDNIDLIKMLMGLVEIKHVPTPTLRATIADNNKVVIVKKTQTGFEGSVYSNDINFISSVKSFFDYLWEGGMDVHLKINEIELGKPSIQPPLLISREKIDEKAKNMDAKAKEMKCLILSKDGIKRAVNWEETNKEFKRRNIKINVITEITNDNIDAVKDFMRYAEVKHFSLGNSPRADIIDSNEGLIIYGSEENIDELIGMWSDRENEVAKMKAYFNRLWLESMPAAQKIKELEDVCTKKTIIISGNEAIDEKAIEMNKNAGKTKCLILSMNGLEKRFALWDKVNGELVKKGVKIRILTEIVPENVEYVKKYMQYAETRHFNIGLSPRLLLIDDKEGFMIYGHDSKPHENISALWSVEKKQIAAMGSYFEKLWSKAVPAETRIDECQKHATQENK